MIFISDLFGLGIFCYTSMEFAGTTFSGIIPLASKASLVGRRFLTRVATGIMHGRMSIHKTYSPKIASYDKI